MTPPRDRMLGNDFFTKELTYLFSKATSHEFAPPVTRCWIPLVTPAACLPMQTRAHRNHIIFDSVPKVTRFLKACPPLNRSRCQVWSQLSLASTHKPQTSNVAYISLMNPWNTGFLCMSKRVLYLFIEHCAARTFCARYSFSQERNSFVFILWADALDEIGLCSIIGHHPRALSSILELKPFGHATISRYTPAIIFEGWICGWTI
jgi:hypothetical protein